MKKELIPAVYRTAIEILPIMARMMSFVKVDGNYDDCLQTLYNTYKPSPIRFEKLTMATDMIDLSFIVPVYNAKAYLRKCVDSLISQKTNYNYEVLLIDDGSTDASPSIADEYAKRFPAFVKVIHQRNGGISVARNKGIECSRGRYIAFVDNDDFVNDDYVEKLISRAYATDADMVKCGHHRWNVAENRDITIIRYDDASYSGDMGPDILSLKGFVWEGCSKRSLWTDWRFPVGYWYEDIITRFVLMRKAKHIEVISDAMYYYCLHRTNASKSVWSHSKIKCLDEIYLLIDMLQNVNGGGTQTAHALLYELGGVLWSRTRGLQSKERKAVFCVARQLVEQYVPDKGEYSDYEKKIMKYYKNGSYLSWRLTSLRQMLKIKLKNDYGK